VENWKQAIGERPNTATGVAVKFAEAASFACAKARSKRTCRGSTSSGRSACATGPSCGGAERRSEGIHIRLGRQMATTLKRQALRRRTAAVRIAYSKWEHRSRSGRPCLLRWPCHSRRSRFSRVMPRTWHITSRRRTYFLGRECAARIGGSASRHEFIGPDWIEFEKRVPCRIPLTYRLHLVAGRRR